MFKKVLWVVVVSFSFPALAKDLNLMSEAGQMGTLYSLASLCGENTQKLKDYELIASRIMATRADTLEEENAVKKEYLWQKFKSFQKYNNASLSDCDQILHQFRRMPLFQSVVYSDGGIKMYDGTYFPSKRPFKKESFQ